MGNRSSMSLFAAPWEAAIKPTFIRSRSGGRFLVVYRRRRKEAEGLGAALRDLRALRYDPPGHAKQGARRTTFQSALEQCEQFLAAARAAGYATRPVQLFYALSQAGRALVAASPLVANSAWRVSGHGLTVDTNAVNVADVAVTVTKAGLFPSVAAALGTGCLVRGEPVALRDLWPLLPESIQVPLTADILPSVLMFSQDGWPEARVFSGATIAWIPAGVKDLYGDDPARVQEHLSRYPALRECTLRLPQPAGRAEWSSPSPFGLSLDVQWVTGSPPQLLHARRTLDDLGVMTCKAADDYVITPAIGSMSAGLHPFLALWAVLLGLSSLARYEPAAWSKMIDIDKSAEANAVENLLNEAINSVSEAALHLLAGFQ
jgi:hypothetical protein